MNIYVGNLSWDMSEDELRDLFTPFGEVASAKIVTDKFNNNRSKGFGFVEMPNQEEGLSAISNLNDSEIMGRKLVVNESQPRPKSDGGGGGGFRKKSFGGGGGGGGYRKGGGGGGYNKGGGGGGYNKGGGGGGYNKYGNNDWN